MADVASNRLHRLLKETRVLRGWNAIQYRKIARIRGPGFPRVAPGPRGVSENRGARVRIRQFVRQPGEASVRRFRQRLQINCLRYEVS